MVLRFFAPAKMGSLKIKTPPGGYIYPLTQSVKINFSDLIILFQFTQSVNSNLHNLSIAISIIQLFNC